MMTWGQLTAALVCLAALAQSESDFLAIFLGPDPRTDYHFLNNNEVTIPDPPPVDQAAKMARFVVHYSNWASLSHVSLQPGMRGFPMARVYSISDGPIANSSGTPYFYMTPNDVDLMDIMKDSRVSLAVTLAQSPWCKAHGWDPEDPRCSQVVLTGKFTFLKNTTAEWKVAQEAMFTRHPVMKTWPGTHYWVFCKLDIRRILLVDNIGGNKYPSVKDYYKAKLDICSPDNPMLDFHFF